MMHTSLAPTTRSTSTVPFSLGRRLVGALVGAAVTAVAAGWATSWAADALVGPLSAGTTAALIVAEVYLCVAVALVAVFGRTRENRQRILALRRPPEQGMRLGAAAWFGAYVAAAVLYLAAAVFGASPAAVVDVLLGVGADGGRLADASVPVVALILVRVCLLVPVAEELLFRGALFTWLRTRLSPAWAIGISGTLFGLMHQLPTFILLAVIVGLVAGWLREKTGSTVVPIAMHVVQNVAVVLVSFVVTGWEATLPMG